MTNRERNKLLYHLIDNAGVRATELILKQLAARKPVRGDAKAKAKAVARYEYHFFNTRQMRIIGCGYSTGRLI